MPRREADRELRTAPASDSDEFPTIGNDSTQNAYIQEGQMVQFRYEGLTNLTGIVSECTVEGRNTWVTIVGDDGQFYKVNRNKVWKLTKIIEIDQMDSSEDEDIVQEDEVDKDDTEGNFNSTFILIFHMNFPDKLFLAIFYISSFYLLIMPLYIRCNK
jgi:hypothetical protein